MLTHHWQQREDRNRQQPLPACPDLIQKAVQNGELVVVHGACPDWSRREPRLMSASAYTTLVVSCIWDSGSASEMLRGDVSYELGTKTGWTLSQLLTLTCGLAFVRTWTHFTLAAITRLQWLTTVHLFMLLLRSCQCSFNCRREGDPGQSFPPTHVFLCKSYEAIMWWRVESWGGNNNRSGGVVLDEYIHNSVAWLCVWNTCKLACSIGIILLLWSISVIIWTI